MSRTNDGRLAYADLLRVAACLAVIILHCSGGWLSASPVGSADFHILNLWDGLTRWCVPLFVMLSGMFLLDPKKSVPLPALFFKYIPRVLAALVVWGALYALWDAWPGLEGLSLSWFLGAMKSAALGNTHYHLWYLYMMVGLYLLTPILRAFVKGASRSDFHYFFLITFVAFLLLPTLLKLHPSATVSLYLDRLNLYMLSGYGVYFVAGYYLKEYTLGRLAEFVIYALGILSGVATVWGTAALSQQSGSLNTLLYGYTTPNVALMALAVFTLFRYLLGVSDERSRRQRLGGVAQLTFGVYLVHDFFIILLRQLGLMQPALTPALAIPLQALFIFFCSLAVVWPLSKIPLLGKYLT